MSTTPVPPGGLGDDASAALVLPIEGEVILGLRPPEEQERFLDGLDTEADRYLAENARPNTKRSYDGDWRVWEEFCTTVLRVDPLTARRGLMVAFVEYLRRQQLAPATIDRRLAGVSVRLTEHGVAITRQMTRAARAALDAYKRELARTGAARGRGQAEALTIPDLRQSCAWLDGIIADPDHGPRTRLLALRDKALLLVGFAMAARRSELAGLWAADVEVRREGLIVIIRAAKTSSESARIPILRGENPATCPVRAWLAYDAAVREHVPDDGRRAFVDLDRRAVAVRIVPGMDPRDVGEALTRLGRDAGLDIHVTGHSLRAGLVTAARRAGRDAKSISRHARFAEGSTVVQRYMRQADEFGDENATGGIGL